MNERKNNKQTRNEKDYYFPVILSQILCCTVSVALFFFLRGSSDWQQLSEKYSSLLQEDFLTAELGSAVSGVKDYFISGGTSFAVNSNRVEPYNQYEEGHTEESGTQTEDAHNNTEDESLPVVQTMSFTKVSQTVPLKLEYKNSSDIIAPVSSVLYTSYFGERTDPIEGGEDYHKGIDIAADEGEPIKAVLKATVSSVGEDERSGKYVFLNHGKGVVTFYCHCSEILVNEGETVSQGDVIALVGSTGYSTGPHLHFEVRMNGESVDPLPLLENGD